MTQGQEYDVWTDMNETQLTEASVKLFMKWMAFALGAAELNGHRVGSPTGRMASALRIERKSATHVAVVMDGNIAPEANILETGHRAVDLKQTGLAGRAIPLHRGIKGQWGSAGYGPAVVASPTAGPSLWASARSQGFTGFRTVPKPGGKSQADAWVIPAMPAWSPAGFLAEMAQAGRI